MQSIVELTPQTQGGWELCTDLGCGGNGAYPAVELPHNSGPEDILFIINAPAGSGIRFPDDPKDAIYVQPNSKPTSKVYDGAGQLGQPKLSKSKMVLTLKDKNKGTTMDFHYQLNFVGAPAIDPVIKNGGGTNAPTLPVIGSDPVVALIVGLGIGVALTALLLRRMIRPKTS